MSVPFILQNIISDHNINYQSAIFYQFSIYQWSHFSKKYQFSLLSVISTLLKCISYQLSVVPIFQILSVAYISELIKKRPTDKKKTYVETKNAPTFSRVMFEIFSTDLPDFQEGKILTN